jgi:hypothetical protein
MPLEIRLRDLVRLRLIDAFKVEMFTMARRADGDCTGLDS